MRPTRTSLLLIDRYFPVNRVRWNPTKYTTELVTLQTTPPDDYKDEATAAPVAAGQTPLRHTVKLPASTGRSGTAPPTASSY